MTPQDRELMRHLADELEEAARALNGDSYEEPTAVGQARARLAQLEPGPRRRRWAGGYPDLLC